MRKGRIRFATIGWLLLAAALAALFLLLGGIALSSAAPGAQERRFDPCVERVSRPLPPEKQAFVDRMADECHTAVALPTASTDQLRRPTVDPAVTPTPTPVPLTGVEPACTAADLDVIWTGPLGANGGQMMAWIKVGNHSNAPCFLRGMPTLELLGQDGDAVDLEARPCPPRETPGGLFGCDPNAPVLLAPRLGRPEPEKLVPGQARMLLMWSTHDGVGRCTSPVWPVAAVTGLRVGLPPSGDEALADVPVGRGPGKAACGSGVVSYGPFRDDWYR